MVPFTRTETTIRKWQRTCKAKRTELGRCILDRRTAMLSLDIMVNTGVVRNLLDPIEGLSHHLKEEESQRFQVR